MNWILKPVPAWSVFFLIFSTAPILLAQTPTLLAATPEAETWIVTATGGSEAAATAVRSVGAEVTHELAIIGGVSARLSADELAELAAKPEIRKLWRDRAVEMASVPAEAPSGDANGFSTYTHYPAQTGAAVLHAFGVDGDGVTVAVIDTGYWQAPGLKKNRDQEDRVLAQYNAMTDEVVSTFSKGVTTDDNGHGSHVSSVILDSSRKFGLYRGVAPGADLVSVQAFDAAGVSTYSDVIRGLDWVVRHRNTYDIRVLNLSFGAPPQSFYWDDPLNRAVMAAWREGLVVVTSAGNGGPDPFTVSVPGNVPYVITVGAVTDSYSPYAFSDDVLTSFSAAGPTAAGWVKPDMVTYGGHVLAAMPADSTIGEDFPQWAKPPRFYSLSGTSQAAAVTSGVVALMLQADPSLTPDDVKCRLTASALVALDENGNDAYNPLQQGAGLVNAVNAVLSDASGCGNSGLDIAADLDEDQHWGGPVRQDDDGNLFILVDGEPYFLWDGSYVPTGGVVFSEYNPWLEASYNPWLEKKVTGDYNPWLEGGFPTPEYNPWLENYAWLDYNPWLEGNSWIELYPEVAGPLPGRTATGIPAGYNWADQGMLAMPAGLQE